MEVEQLFGNRAPSAPSAMPNQIEDKLSHLVGMFQQVHQSIAAMAAVAAAPRVKNSSAIRVAPLPYYSGDGQTLDEWIATLTQQQRYYEMASEGEAIRYAVVHLRGAASDWFGHLNAVPTTMAELITLMKARFQPITAEEVARGRLHELEQGKQSINDYISSFRRIIISIPSMDTNSLMYAFQRGLRPALQVVIKTQMPRSLEEAISLAARVGSNMQNGSSSSSSSHQAASSNESMDLSVAEYQQYEDKNEEEESIPKISISQVQLNAIISALSAKGRNNGSGSDERGAQGASGGYKPAKGLPTIRGLTETQVKEYMDANKCFNCGKPGHGSRFCRMARQER